LYPGPIDSRLARDVPGGSTGHDPGDGSAVLRARKVRLQRARLAVIGYFAVLGVASGVWLARIPAIKQDLHLSDGLLGVALLAGPAGLVAVVPVASRVVHRYGSRRPTLVAGICIPLIPVALGLAPDLAALMAALLVLGFTGGMLDIAMNSQAVLVERGAGRPLMTSFHSCFSFGGLVGALCGGLFASVGISPAVNFAVVGVPLVCVALLLGPWLVADNGGEATEVLAIIGPGDVVMEDQGGQPLTPAEAEDNPVPPGADGHGEIDRQPSSATLALLLIGVLALCSLLAEGAAEGWSAVYLRDNVGTSAGLAAFGYAAFAVTMACGRLAGDRLALRFGPVMVMRCGGLIAAAGLGLALLTGTAAGAIAGFALYGAGLSCMFPLMMSAAGNIDPARPSRGIARVAGFGYAGLLGGPVLIGGLASAIGLQKALDLPVALTLVIAAGAHVITVRRR
jgi:MFS family permease